MTSGGSRTELADVLTELSSVLARLCESHVAQRAAVAAGDLQRLLAVTEEQEALSAQLAQHERRRQIVQRSLEAALGVHGLRAISARWAQDGGELQLQALVDAVAELAARLRQEHEQSAWLLRSAWEAARRTRGHLLRLAGAEPAYRPTGAGRAAAVVLRGET